MSDHKFEKQVRQKLGDLKLTPSAKAWERIETDLRESRRRRIPYFWLSLLLVGLLAGGYFIAGDSTNDNQEGSDLPLAEAMASQHQASDSATGVKDGADQALLQPETLNVTDATENNGPRLTDNHEPGKSFREPVFTHNSIAQSMQRKNSIVIGKENHDQQVGDNHATDSPGDEEDNRTDHPTIVSAPNEDISVPEEELALTTPDNSGPTLPGSGEPDESEENSEVMQPGKKKKTNKKWSFGMAAAGGVSTVNEGKFVNFSTAQVEEVTLLAPPTNAPTAAAPIAIPPSKIESGFSFAAGLVVKRQISNRFALSSGINYLQLNTRTEVGHRVEAARLTGSSNAFNAQSALLYYPGVPNSGGKEYRNKYHFIEVPLTAHLQVNKSEKLPIYWNAGFSVARFLRSNSLHYDRSAGIYYRNDDLLSDYQIGAHTGLSLQLKDKWWIGPDVRYHLSPLLKKNFSARKNFVGVGLEVKWFIR